MNLNGLSIALSGSIPSLAELHDRDLDVQSFQWMLKNVVSALLEKGANIVHDCHPSYTPIVADIAQKYLNSSGKRVRMLAISSFYTPESWEIFEKKNPYADIIPVGEAQTKPDDAFEELATLLSEYSQALVCIGGRKGDSLRTNKQQVEDEIDKAILQQRPVYLLGGCGGLSRDLYRDRFKSNPSLLSNGLDADENDQLVIANPWEAPELVLKGLLKINREVSLV